VVGFNSVAVFPAGRRPADGQFGVVSAAGQNGVSASNSTFGWSLSAGDINGDGASDLAIGSPFDYTDKGYSVGSVAVVYATATRASSPRPAVSGSRRTRPGVPGASHVFKQGDALPDSFGWQVVLADYNGDGKATSRSPLRVRR
jgi:hypothetical protein